MVREFIELATRLLAEYDYPSYGIYPRPQAPRSLQRAMYIEKLGIGPGNEASGISDFMHTYSPPTFILLGLP